MDTIDRARLEAERGRLEGMLLSIEKALGVLLAAPDEAERLRLTASQDSHLAELGVVNAALGATPGPIASA